MMITRQEFLIRARLDGDTLEAWIAEEWLVPTGPIPSRRSPKLTSRAPR